jgi:hypothetical protein
MEKRAMRRRSRSLARIHDIENLPRPTARSEARGDLVRALALTASRSSKSLPTPSVNLARVRREGRPQGSAMQIDHSRQHRTLTAFHVAAIAHDRRSGNAHHATPEMRAMVALHRGFSITAAQIANCQWKPSMAGGNCGSRKTLKLHEILSIRGVVRTPNLAYREADSRGRL